VRVGLPSIVFLLIFGVLIGPEFLALLNPNEFGEGLEIIIKLCVAIILFEAGLNLDKEEVKNHQKVIIPLISNGAAITMIGGAVLAKYALGLSWELSFLYSALVIVTGPTVVQPLLRRIKVKPNLKNILEQEGVFIDPIGAIVAIFVFEIVIQDSPTLLYSAGLVFYRLIIGAIIGAVGGLIVSVCVKKFYIYMEDFSDLFVLVFALGIYALSETIILESGLMAAVVSGMIVGNLNIPDEESLKKFKGKLSILVISLLFMLLASDLEMKNLFHLGIPGILVVLGLLFVIRPIEIFGTLFKTSLNLKEKLFLSYIAPRGIIAASIASLISIELNNRNIKGGEVVQGLVFLTIAISVLLQGSTAKYVASFLKVTYTTNRVVIVGANALGRLLAKVLQNMKIGVCLIDTNTRLVELARKEGLDVVEGNSLDIDQLEKTGISHSDSLVSITTSDKVNTFVSRLAKVDFGITNTHPVLNNIADVIDTQSISKLGLHIAFGRSLNLFDVYSKISSKEYVIFKFNVNKSLNGKSLEDLFLPDHLIPLILKKKKTGEINIYHAGLILETGDKVTILDLSPFATEFDILEDSEKELIEV
ncbi:MAG: cation:proton antiporter, partial [Thermodesulfobacteriota bacterium]